MEKKKKRNPLQILIKIKHHNNFFTYLTKSLTRLCIFEKPLVFQVFIARQYMAYSLCLQKEEHIRLTHCTLPALMPVELFRSGQGRTACGPHQRSTSLTSNSLPSKITVENATIKSMRTHQTITATKTKHHLTEQLANLSVGP